MASDALSAIAAQSDPYTPEHFVRLLKKQFPALLAQLDLMFCDGVSDATKGLSRTNSEELK